MENNKSGNIKKVVIVLVIIGLIAAFKIFGLADYFSLTFLKESQQNFQTMYINNQVPVLAAFLAIYVLVTSLSLPGAAIMTIAAGALFGLLVGTIIVSFASTIGATIACFFARFLLRDWVQTKFGNKLKVVNEGIEKEGAFYLFTARLIPYIPFVLINLAMGLTKIPLRTYFWVSQIGMLPATIVYVNAGKEVAKISSVKDIASPTLIISFILLGVFPIIIKKLLELYKKKGLSDG